MLTKRIIACLDVHEGKVVKGTQFTDHIIVGDIVDLARRYSNEGIDELVFYDISASSDARVVAKDWVVQVAAAIDIPFCVAGGINSCQAAEAILAAGADKISINSPALARPQLIDELVAAFGSQCVVVGVDIYQQAGRYQLYQYTGSSEKMRSVDKELISWLGEVEQRGAGEVVINAMKRDGTKSGFDIEGLNLIRPHLSLPIVASGGAGSVDCFAEVFSKTSVQAALAAGMFHRNEVSVQQVKQYLTQRGIEVRNEL